MNRRQWFRFFELLIVLSVTYIFLMRSGNTSFATMLYNIGLHKRIQILVLGMLFVLLMAIISILGSYWMGMCVYLTVICVIAISNFEKFHYRDEGILPSDLSMITSLNDILAMISPWIIVAGVFMIVGIIILSYVLWHNVDINIKAIFRIIIVLFSVIIFVGFSRIQKEGTVAYHIGAFFKDDPIYWNPSEAVGTNGPILNFFNNLNVEVMDKPKGYSKNEMKRIADKYIQSSEKLNKNRRASNQKVVFILSETLGDPTTVPGIKVNKDPMPYTRSLIKHGVGGKMISDGYGGGTANMEYQALTGLSMGNFSKTLSTPYVQLVTRQKKMFSINNLFSNSMAIHPYIGNLYDRNKVFKKMKFNEFDYLQHGYPQSYTKKLGNNNYVSDKAAYRYLIHSLKNNKNSQFVQLSTMQNHVPFESYKDNEFKVIGKGVSNGEIDQLQNYIKGINYTDKANEYLIKQLKKMKQKVTIVFYGDHHSSVYKHVDLEKNGVLMHETPYFIWTNHGKLNKIPYQSVMGTYGFGSEMLQATNTKVTPYYALLQRVNKVLPIIASNISVSQKSTKGEGGMNLINRRTLKVMRESSLNKSQKKLLHEYQLVQYDFTAGKHYAMKSLNR